MPHRFSLSAVAGFVLLLVPALFIAANVLEYELGIPISWSPFHAIYGSTKSSPLTYFVDSLIIFGPVLGFSALFVPLTRVRWNSDGHGLALTVAVQKPGWTRAGLIFFSMLTTAILGIYLVSENLPCILGHQIIC